MSTTKKRGHSEAFSDALSSYVTGNHLGKPLKMTSLMSGVI